MNTIPGHTARDRGRLDGRSRLDRARRTTYALPGLRPDFLGHDRGGHRRKVDDHVHDIAGRRDVLMCTLKEAATSHVFNPNLQACVFS